MSLPISDVGTTHIIADGRGAVGKQIMLSEQALAYRRDKITATDARNLINAVTELQLNEIYERKLGLLPPEPENYAMRAGSAMEPVILDEYQRNVGEPVIRRQEIVDHPEHKGRFCCTLDGWLGSEQAVVEIKFVSPFRQRDEIFAFYYPQLAFQMACADATRGYLVVGQGTSEPWDIECVRDLAYEDELLERCAAFLFCIKTMTPPVVLPPPIPPEKWRTVDVSKDNINWGDELVTLLTTYETIRGFAENFETLGKQARALIPDDVGRVLTPTHTLARNKKGTIAITRRAA